MSKVVNIFTGKVVDLERPQPQPVKEPEPIELTPAELAAYIEYLAACEESTQNADGVHVGDIFECSWGYEQTQVDFFQVVALKAKHSAVVVKICSTSTRAMGPMSEYRRAVRDSYRPDSEQYTVRTKSNNGRRPSFRCPQMSHEVCTPTDELREHYASWYY